nr:hypothetical protein [uncultured Macellibacteroides sp.]
MSKKEILFLLSLLCFCNCSNPLSDEEEKVPETFPVQFSIQLNKEIIPYVNTRSFPNDSVPEPRSSEDPISSPNSGDVQSLCSRIDYVVYNTENPLVPVKHKRYKSEDATIDFGIVYDSLPMGNYEIRLLAHSSATNELTENSLTFDEVTDAFYNQTSIIIGSGEKISKDINLQRIVGRVEFMATDTIHSNLKQFKIQLTGYPNKFNLLTGKGIPSVNEFTINHLFTPEETGKENNIHSLLSFIPEENKSMVVKLTATDMLDRYLWSYSIESVIPQVNKILRYSGKLYSPRSSNESVNLYLENINWGETIDIPLID